jgi:hypothetical protein
MDADQILGRVLELYQSCPSYTDAGVSSDDMGDLEFRSYFCRPNKFRFEWSLTFGGQQTRRNVIFSETDAKATYFDGETLEETSGLALAVAGATGISLGVAPLVAHLLMPDLFEAGQYESLVSLRPYSLIRENNTCFEIRADGPSNCSTTLFVEKLKPVLRRIELRITPTLDEKKQGIEALELLEASEVEEVRTLMSIEEMPTQSVVLYNEVKFDVPISPDIFRGV